MVGIDFEQCELKIVTRGGIDLDKFFGRFPQGRGGAISLVGGLVYINAPECAAAVFFAIWTYAVKIAGIVGLERFVGHNFVPGKSCRSMATRN